jgi:hypothetical protein
MNRKSEIRNPKPERNPKAEIRTRRNETEILVLDRTGLILGQPRPLFLLGRWASAFGLRISGFFRISGFGFRVSDFA